MADYLISKIDRVNHQSNNLKHIHKASATLKHAIWKNEEWQSFIPTYFIYSYFTFNTLYNIDWSESLKRGFLWNGRKGYEEIKQSNYLYFCFEDGEFVDLYKHFFIDFVIKSNKGINIIDELSKIKVDEYWHGSIKKQLDIDIFVRACKDVFEQKNFNRDNVIIIIDFIYKIRCNIFHGEKTIKELYDQEQMKRLLIYATILIAINQMVFSYIDYLLDDDIHTIKNYNKLIKELSVFY